MRPAGDLPRVMSKKTLGFAADDPGQKQWRGAHKIADKLKSATMVSCKSAVLAVNWVSVSARNFLPYAQSHGSATMRGRGID